MTDTNVDRYRREVFENRVFQQRFLGSIRRNPDPRPRICGAMDLVSDCPDRAEVLKRDDRDNYVDPYISAMWFGWRLAIDHVADQVGILEEQAEEDMEALTGLRVELDGSCDEVGLREIASRLLGELTKLDKWAVMSTKHGFVGNNIMFWRHGGAGYTTRLAEVGVWSQEEAMKRHDPKNGHFAVPVALIVEKADGCVDMQIGLKELKEAAGA